MDKFQFLKNQLRKHWYVQAGSAVPVFLQVSGYSGFVLKEYLGFGYSEFLYQHRESWGEMYYKISDLERIWKAVKEKLKQDPQYLKSVKKKYEQIFKKHEKFFSQIEKIDLKKLNDQELLEILKKFSRAQIDTIGLAHINEAVGTGLERAFKEKLEKEIKDAKKFNQYFAILTAPTELSFVGQEQRDILNISKSPERKKEEMLRNHFKKYFWFQNSYAGPLKLTLEFFQKRLNQKNKESNPVQNIVLKRKLIQQLNLSEEAREMIELIDLETAWQDERKANVLKTINYFSQILEEVSRRTNIKLEHIYFISIFDILELKNIKDLKEKEEEFHQSFEGSFFYHNAKGEVRIYGKDYLKLKKYLESQREGVVGELHGAVANPGKAVIGRVVICNNISEIDKVRKGDVLVTSMTRPEFMTAIRKAAAIVTDEGGITSHAAIVSRELNIPCVIGTKIATKIFKDGDKIEVRANHGIVRKL